jgi:hypothetical protein
MPTKIITYISNQNLNSYKGKLYKNQPHTSTELTLNPKTHQPQPDKEIRIKIKIKIKINQKSKQRFSRSLRTRIVTTNPENQFHPDNN